VHCKISSPQVGNAARAGIILGRMEMKGYEDFQKVGQENFDATVKSFGEVNKGVQAIAGEVTDYTKKAIEEGTAAFEKLLGVKSLDQAIEIQTTYAKKAYDDYVSQMTKLGEMYVDIAKEAYKPVESAFAKKS
jgi:phasin family protein